MHLPVFRSAAVAVVLVLAALAALAQPTGTRGAPAQTVGVSGNFSLIMMVHTLASIPEYNVAATKPWDGANQPGETFTYRSIPCTGNAPVNNISSDLPSYNTRVARSRAPSSLRAHPYEFNVVRRTIRTRLKPLRRNAKPRFRIQRFWELSGRITLTVCKLGPGPTANPDPIPDPAKPKIFVSFRARYSRSTAEAVRWTGTFTLTGGTERYADLKGSGSIAGYFFCFAAEGCAAKGSYQDGQFVMHGTYTDPTPQLS
ncbi:MAG: hypothetical protein H0V79_03040 [Actinobacteria bacterium]|nr:hypothetical protein [Actinomycetota bacterium]